MAAKTIPSSTSLSVSALVLTFLLCISSNVQRSSAAITATKNSTKTYTNFLKTACNSTTYPQLCFKSLSSYTSTIKTSELKLCSTSLTVALKASSNTSKLVKSLAKNRGLSKIEAAIIRDCIEEIGNSIDEIKQSLKILGNLTDPDREYQIDNMKTWVSAAITDQNTCTDGFDGRKISYAVKRTIRKSIVNVARLTSNALALINKLS
ncbi:PECTINESTERASE INHIBITOR-LIKE [Salix purpurea]|uniref:PECTINESTERASE INHIBITOR-LIKE n=1 Tax=Salix purpurea TaxID=77065 RepID=A0A9Q1A7Z2_SALPP|nr:PECTINESTERASE INHIBITOR-LIKE [Salix purpurea]